MKYESFETLDDGQLERAASLFEALSHPVRLRIVAGLLDGGCCVNDMVDCLGLPQPYVSRHLAVLRDAGVIEAHPEGRERRYRVVHPAAEPLVRLLQTLLPRSSHEPADL